MSPVYTADSLHAPATEGQAFGLKTGMVVGRDEPVDEGPLIENVSSVRLPGRHWGGDEL